jgi:hypothetical protein
MEDITCGPDDPNDPDAWMWSFDDARQNVLLPNPAISR